MLNKNCKACLKTVLCNESYKGLNLLIIVLEQNGKELFVRHRNGVRRPRGRDLLRRSFRPLLSLLGLPSAVGEAAQRQVVRRRMGPRHRRH